MKSEMVVKSLDGSSERTMQVPQIFRTSFRPEVIHRVYVNLLSHKFQKQGRYPAAGELVSAESRNTGLGIARLGPPIARPSKGSFERKVALFLRRSG